MDSFNHKNKIKTTKSSAVVGQNLLWKSAPPGPEQLELNRLFASGEITDTDTANSVRLTYPMFRGFSARVFGLHFRKTKAKYGKMCKYNKYSRF